MNKRSKHLALVLILIVMFGITAGGVYSYWAGAVADPADITDGHEVTIGSGKDVTTKLEVTKEIETQGKRLVPVGKAALSTGGTEQNVESFEATYTVYWKESEGDDVISSDDNITGQLSVTATPSISEAEAYNDLVSVSVQPATTQITADGNAVEVTVKVTLEEPADKTAYDAIINRGISVDLTFAVEQ